MNASIVESENPGRILVFRIGLLGDTLVALPSLHALRENFPGAPITLLHDRPVGGQVQVQQLLRGSGLIDDFLTYPVLNRSKSRATALCEMAVLLAQLRARRYGLLVNLAPSDRTPKQDARAKRFFELAGISRQITTSEYRGPPPSGHPLPNLPQEADFLLSCLGNAGLRVPPPGAGVMDLRLGAAEEAEVTRWEQAEGLKGERRLRVAFGPGSKMSAKRWPLERYLAVAQQLVRERDIMPVVFGGAEDRAAAAQLIAACGRGVSACGKLSLRGAIRALRDCRLYVGNDTGTMHMAAAAGIPCVAIFSARNAPGKWYPYGPGHRVHRVAVSCEGCWLEVCTVEGMRCLKAIEPAEVLASCAGILEVTSRNDRELNK